MLIKNRPDGTYLKSKGFFKLMPYIMPTRTESAIYFEQEVDITEALKLIEEQNKGKTDPKEKLTFFHLFVASCIRTIVERPKLNRFVNYYRFYQRNNISINFIAKKEFTDEAEEVNVTVYFSPYDTLTEVSNKLLDAIYTAKRPEGNKNQQDIDVFSFIPHPFLKFVGWLLRYLNNHNMLPKSMIHDLPFFSTAFIANIGSIGIDAPFHHNFELGTTGLFIALGKIKEKDVKQADGTYETRKVIKVNYTHDDRVADGVYCAKALNMIKEKIEKPQMLMEKIELDDKQLDWLKLKDHPTSKEYLLNKKKEKKAAKKAAKKNK